MVNEVRWYAHSAEEVASELEVEPSKGLSEARANELLAANGPNALPEEKPTPGWRRFLDQYRAYMQIILCGAAIVSFAMKEWSTGSSAGLADPAQRRGGSAPGG